MKRNRDIVEKFIYVTVLLLLGSMNVFASNNWQFTVFGNVGGQDKISEKYFKIKGEPASALSMKVSGNKGKISSSTDGLMFYYKELDSSENFEISADLEIKNYSKNNQVSFGLMLRDEILVNKSEKSFVSNYIAAGPLNLKKSSVNYALVRKDKKLSKKGKFTYSPLVGDTLKLNIKKSGDIYQVTVGDEEPVIIDNMKFTGKKLYVGTYVVRNADVVFKNIEIKKDKSEVSELLVDSSKLSRKDYLIGEKISQEGLSVKAILSNGSEKILTPADYILTGFNSSKAGKAEVMVNYNGLAKSFAVDVKDLSLTKLNVKYLPAKMSYYKLDKFKAEGMSVIADYNDGYKLVELNDSDYSITVNGVDTTSEKAYVFTDAGEYEVKITSKENSAISSKFSVDVIDTRMYYLNVKELPEKIEYFLGEKLDLTGMVVYAEYMDGSKVRLTNDEYTVDELDSSSTGIKVLKIHHKNNSRNLVVNVKEKGLEKVALTKYPRTTYYVGEKFDSTGMIVSNIYDNGDAEEVKAYKVDASDFNAKKPGEYTVEIKTANATVELKTVVRAKKTYEWKTSIFGQSTKVKAKNFVKKTGDVIEVAALNGGGKITGDHDGITFYYVELDANKDNFTLSADVKVKSYAKKSHDGQESFGLMARDALGVNGDSALSASNIAILGGFSGGTKYKNGTQLLVRTGVTAQNGAGSKGLQKTMIKQERPNSKNTPYRLTLVKTNSGFTGKIDNGEEVLILEPEILKVQDNKMYVGFFAARVADIEVSNVSLQVSSARVDAPKIEKPKKALSPSILVESLEKVSTEDYSLLIKSNVDGIVNVRKGKELIAEDYEVKAGEKTKFKTLLDANKETNFSILFTPNNTQFLTSYESIIKNFTVDMRTYRDGKDMYVAVNGTPNGDGSEAKPLDLDTAIDFVMPGQTIVVKAGRYERNKSLIIAKYNDGTKKKVKRIVAEKGARPVIDFNRRVEGVIHSGNYWHIYGLDFTQSAPNRRGYVLGGNHNVIEFCEFYENGDTGMQIARTDYTEYNIANWPSYNLVKNCTSYNNSDPSENNADGFAAKLTVGYGNVFDGCISHNNADDGWDLYAKVGTGKIGPVTILNSVVYGNGALVGKKPGKGDGNGFKLGGEGLNVHHVIKNSVAFGNFADGFTSNSNPGVIAENNVSFNNKRNVNFSSYTGIDLDFTINNFYSYHFANKLEAESDVIADEDKSNQNYFFNGDKTVNSKGNELKVLEQADLVMPSVVTRNADGSVDFSFLD